MMHKKLKIGLNTFFLIEDAKEKIFTNDDVILSIVIDQKRYYIMRDSYNYEIGYMLKYFSDSNNFIETNSEDLGRDYFLFQNDLNCDIKSRDLHEFDNWVAFGGDIAILFYKKNDKMFCQISQNDWLKGNYASLFVTEVSLNMLEEWKQILA